MKKYLIFLLIFLFMLPSCGAEKQPSGSAQTVLANLIAKLHLPDGDIRSSEKDAEKPLTDAFLSSLFLGQNVDDFRYVKSSAAYFSKRFSQDEILVFELYDFSHAEDIAKILQVRADKKANAKVIEKGRYVYMISLENINYTD